MPEVMKMYCAKCDSSSIDGYVQALGRNGIRQWKVACGEHRTHGADQRPLDPKIRHTYKEQSGRPGQCDFCSLSSEVEVHQPDLSIPVYPGVARNDSQPDSQQPQSLAKQSFRQDLKSILDELFQRLCDKNDAYGDSALNPIRVFARGLDVRAQIRVRLDDKLSRLMRGEIRPGTDIAAEDVFDDILGYLVLDKIAKLRETVGS